MAVKLRQIRLKHKIKRRYVIIIAILLCILLVITTRSWVRNDALSWYSNQTAGNQVNSAFESSFASVNKQFNSNGVPPIVSSYSGPVCGTDNYHYFRVTVLCLRVQGVDNSNHSSTPQSLINNWPTVLQSLKIGESQGSWQQELKSNTNVTDPIKLFSFTGFFTVNTRNSVAFIRNAGGVQCSLEVDATPAISMYASEYFIDESCYKNVNFFGGWDCSKEYCKV